MIKCVIHYIVMKEKTFRPISLSFFTVMERLSTTAFHKEYERHLLSLSLILNLLSCHHFFPDVTSN
jgi:hypothetical protein